MVVGGDEMIKKSKRTKAIKHASSKKTKDSKNQKRRKKGKGSRIRSRSKTKKTSPSSRATSVEASGEKKTDDEQYRAKANECDGSCMVKPEKLTQTCTSLWSEPTTCCIDKPIVTGPPCENVICKNVCLKLAREEVYSEAEKQHAQAKLCIDRLSNERNYFKAEFERLLRILQEIGESKDEKEANNLYCLACQKNDKMIEYLQKENEVLAKEKFCLMLRLEEGVSRFDVEATSGKCCKTSCKRTERERDLLRLDIQRLEEETDCLREKIKVLSENKTRDYARFQEQRAEYENVINRLEGEKRELMKGQGIRRLNINTLEEKVDMYTNSLKVAQEETQRVKTQYSQLKKLHDQCDKALLDTQAQLMEVEMQLLNYQNKKDPARRNSKDIQASLPKYSCTDVDIQANITTPKDIQMTIQQLNTDKDNLLNINEENPPRI